MKRLLCVAGLGMLAILSMTNLNAAQQETRFFEMRTYYAAPGKLDDLLARFRDHTMALFEKHGMANIGYWLPLTNTDNKLVYILAYPSREARETSWKAFSSDPEWKKVAAESEKNGKLVTRADPVFMTATDFSPEVKSKQEAGPRVFELRTYHAAPGKFEALLARFREHTTKLFEKHGMSNFGYWVPTESKDGAGERLIYILAHKSQSAGEASFKAFRSDPEWTKVKNESEANGALTVTNGVQSLLMAPTDFSPTR